MSSLPRIVRYPEPLPDGAVYALTFNVATSQLTLIVNPRVDPADIDERLIDNLVLAHLGDAEQVFGPWME